MPFCGRSCLWALFRNFGHFWCWDSATQTTRSRSTARRKSEACSQREDNVPSWQEDGSETGWCGEREAGHFTCCLELSHRVGKRNLAKASPSWCKAKLLALTSMDCQPAWKWMPAGHWGCWISELTSQQSHLLFQLSSQLLYNMTLADPASIESLNASFLVVQSLNYK